jgi:signal transduction histidine kinase
MTIKKQFILLSSIIVTIPILTILFIVMQHYLSSPRSVMLEAYNNLLEESQNEYSEKDLQIIRQTLERISPDFEFVLFSREKVLISTIPEINKSDTVNTTVLINLINSSSKKYIYQYRLINEGTTDFFLFSRIQRGNRRYGLRTITFAYLILFILVLIFFCIILIVIISKNIFRSIEKLDNQTQAIADGNLDLKIDISHDKKSNEITSMAANLEKMRISLLEAQNQKYKFIMGISHDLRTPVSIIKGYTEALHDGVITEHKEILDSLELISTKTTQLEEMIDTLLSYIKLNNIELRNTFVSQSITEFIKSFAKSAEITGNIFKRNIILNLKLPYDIHIPFDYQLTNRAFENIFVNAIRYTKDDDSIYISASIKQETSNKETHKAIVFSIRDTGQGIKKEDLNNIFDLFYRGTSSRREEGLGVGLSVVKNIIETHGWTIKVTSKLNEGSNFIITIPFE